MKDFDRVETQEGFLYELGRGVVTVVDVPNPRHFAQVMAIRRALMRYDMMHPSVIHGLAAGSECKIPVDSTQSERHPDLAVYLTPLPSMPGSLVWAAWVPEIVIEVVSPGSEARDYQEKPAEYFAFGVTEYWIADASTEVLTVMTRSEDGWAERRLGAGAVYETRLLPGFTLNVADVFAAARLAGA